MTGDEIAIIGMYCRVPGAENLEAFWDNLLQAKHTITFLTAEEQAQITDRKMATHPAYVPCKGGVFPDAGHFDAPFFGYSPKEAALMDPQLRIFHQGVWNALEDAGYTPQNFSGDIGLYAGASDNLQWKNNVLFNPDNRSRDNFAISQLIDKDFICSRVAYNINLTGPCYAVQTACSTSLVAVHLACQGILNGECDIAVAGGVSVHYGLEEGYIYKEGAVLSPDGYCKAFDADAGGTVPGSGVGIVVLKLLADALEDGDAIHAIIKGSAINNDGNRKVGYTSPSVSGQLKVIRNALKTAEVDPATISYLEAHGTGTHLGDPIELEALKLAYGVQPAATCGIGSVKTNIGHLDVAAGVIGLIKTALAMKHRKLPPSLGFTRLNERIDLQHSPFYVVDRLKDWTSASGSLRAGVSSFGIGGTNAHIILEEFTTPTPVKADEKGYHLFMLSAKTTSSLAEYLLKFEQYLIDHPGISLPDAAYTLSVGRTHFSKRITLVAEEREQLLSLLHNCTEKQGIPEEKQATKDVIFLFSGQGSQYVNMGADMYRHIPLFKTNFDKCLHTYYNITGTDIRVRLYPTDATTAEQNETFNHTSYVQPLLYMFEYALAKTLMDIGIKPVEMIGHSIGEYVAACLAGVFTFEEGLQIVIRRGELMQQMPAGAMLSVNISSDALSPLLPAEICIAAVNTSQNCVVAGSIAAIKAFEIQLSAGGYQCILLKTSHAFHSTMMQPVCKAFEQFLSQFSFKPTSLPFVSNLTGNTFPVGSQIPASYWLDHILGTVNFAKGIDTLTARYPSAFFLELGPGHSLASFARKSKHYSASEHKVSNTVRHINQQERDDKQLLVNLAALCTGGINLAVEKLFTGKTFRRLHLPGYVFDKHNYNIATPLRTINDVMQLVAPAAPATTVTDIYYVPVWEQLVIQAGSTKRRPLTYLIFAGQRDNDQLLLEEIRKHSEKLIIVAPGEAFAVSGDHYTINPTVKEDYYQLLNALKERDLLPDRILHAWTMEGVQKGMLSLERLNAFKHYGFYSIVYLIQGIGALGITRPMNIDIIAGNSLAVFGYDGKYPEQALLYGLIKIIPLEYPAISCRYLDISDDDLKMDATGTFKHVLTLVTSDSNDGPLIALRGTNSWIQKYRAVEPAKGAGSTLLKPGGTYLITGGTGGMAITIAAYLVSRYNANVILLGRSALSDLEQSTTGDALYKQSLLSSIREAGKLDYRQVDVCDAAAMEIVFGQVERTYGRINGVLHTAAIIDHFGAIQKRSVSDFEDSMRVKVDGTLILQQLFQGKDLDFMLLFSSAGTINYGSKYGESGYVAANDFLDAMSNCQTLGARTVVKSISWCDWSKVGLSVKSIDRFFGDDLTAKDAALVLFEQEALSPTEGAEAFAHIMATNWRHTIISKSPLKGGAIQAIDGWRQKQALFLQSNAKDKTVLKRQTENAEYIAPADELQQQIAGIWQSYFGYTGISIHDNIFELGANSLDVAQINEVFKSELKIDIPLVTLFEYPSVYKLANYIRSIGSKKIVAPSPGKIEMGKNNMQKMRAMSKK